MTNTECKNFTMEIFNKTWYKDLEEPDTFYTNFTDLKLLNHLNKFCLGLHAVYTVTILQLTKTLYADADGISKFINMMEAAQRSSKGAKI